MFASPSVRRLSLGQGQGTVATLQNARLGGRVPGGSLVRCAGAEQGHRQPTSDLLQRVYR